MTETESKMWYQLALIYGWNELARASETIGEKTFCRLACQNAKEEYEKLGGQIKIRDPNEKPVIVLSHHIPSINFYERDIELMRKAVATYDARKLLEKELSELEGLKKLAKTVDIESDKSTHETFKRNLDALVVVIHQLDELEKKLNGS